MKRFLIALILAVFVVLFSANAVLAGKGEIPATDDPVLVEVSSGRAMPAPAVCQTAYEIDVQSGEEAVNFGKEYWGVFVGVTYYQYIGKASYMAEAATKLYNHFKDAWGEDHVLLLTDSDAAKADIRDAITVWLDGREDSDDTTFFYMGGHGSSEYICPYDTLTSSYANDISSTELDGWMDSLENKKATIVLESCYSGSFLDNLSLSGRVVMTSSDVYESSYGDSILRDPFFVHYLLEGIAKSDITDANSDGSVSSEELYAYAAPKTTDWAWQIWDRNQHPQLADGCVGEVSLFGLSSVTFDADADGVYIRIDGVSYYSLPVSLNWIPNTAHSIEASQEYYVTESTRFSFSSWSDGSADRVRSVRAESGYRTYEAHYNTQHYLTATSWYGTAEGSGWYDAGTKASIATQDEVSSGVGTRYSFTGWKVDSDPALNTDNPFELTMDVPHSAEATYKIQYYLAITSQRGTAEGSGWYDAGTKASLKAQDEVSGEKGTRYIFTDWKVNSDPVLKTESSFELVMNSPCSAQANYKTQYYLEVKAEHGTASKKTGWYDEGRTVIITAETLVMDGSVTRYSFTGWSIGSNDPTCSVQMVAPRTVTAQYTVQYYLEVLSERGDPQGSGWYNAGTKADISVASSEGSLIRHLFSRWDGGAVDEKDPETQVSMTGPKTVTAQWQTDYSYLIILLVSVFAFVVVLLISLAVRARQR